MIVILVSVFYWLDLEERQDLGPLIAENFDRQTASSPFLLSLIIAWSFRRTTEELGLSFPWSVPTHPSLV